MEWSWIDAVNLAIDLKNQEEYCGADVDVLANDLWREMERENYMADVARGEVA